MKIVILLMIGAIIASLGSAGMFMLRKGDPNKPRNRNMARALALRVALSIGLFLLILLAWHLGLIHPNGIAVAN